MARRTRKQEASLAKQNARAKLLLAELAAQAARAEIATLVRRLDHGELVTAAEVRQALAHAKRALDQVRQ
jgi:hypothetical protein